MAEERELEALLAQADADPDGFLSSLGVWLSGALLAIAGAAAHVPDAGLDAGDTITMAERSSATEVVRKAFLDGLRPEPQLTVSEWSDRYRKLTDKDPEPGQWRTSRAPYLREVLDSFSARSQVDVVVMMWGAQLGKTSVLLNVGGYSIHQSPAPVLYVLPDLIMARRFSSQRFAPMIAATPVLRERVRESRKKDSNNAVLSKDFPGGTINFVGTQTAAGLRMFPVKRLLMDEVDAYESDIEGEGDPITLAMARLRNFSGSKAGLASTPTEKGRSKIEALYLLSDQRKFFVPCPHCETMQVLTWENVKFDKAGDLADTGYMCAECKALIEEGAKTWMLEHGEWRATAQGRDRWRGYQLSSLYSPIGWYSWKQAARELLDCEGNPDALRGWVNTTLAETYRVAGEAPDDDVLFHHNRIDYAAGTVPDGALVITAGADVQKDRIEIEIVGWAPRHVSWSIDYIVIPGDTATDLPWKKLTELRATTFPSANGRQLPISMLAIDSGYLTTRVYQWVRAQPVGTTMATKGFHHLPAIVGLSTSTDIRTKGKRYRRGVKLWPIGTNVAKDELYSWLRQRKPNDPNEELPHGWSFFPSSYTAEHFKRLTAEERQLVRKGGRVHVEWSLRAGRERNEQLDCRILARAATVPLGMDRWMPDVWLSLGAVPDVEPPAPPRQDGPSAPPNPRTPDAPPGAQGSTRRGSIYGRWRTPKRS